MEFPLRTRHGSWMSASSLRLKTDGTSPRAFARYLSAAVTHSEYMME